MNGRSHEPTHAAGSGDLERGRRAFERRAWADAYQALALAGRSTPLDAEDLERLALSAYLIERDDEYLAALEAAHRAHLEHGRTLCGARCAFWLGLRLAFRGELGPAGGWFARGERLLRDAPEVCAERGYLLLPAAEEALQTGQPAAAESLAARAAAIGEHCSDPDLTACARHVQGRAVLEQARTGEGLALLDETMVAVTSGELSPLVTGLIYCSVLEACQRAYLLGRACEWTTALSRWCDQQPQMIAFSGKCQVHRAEVMQLRGAWHEAIEAAQRVCQHYASGRQQRDAAAGYYRIGEVHRLQGEFERAEQAYNAAAGRGRDPQPGLALLRLAQGRVDVAGTAIRRALDTTADPLPRARLLAAEVEIALAAGEAENARRSAQALAEIAARHDADALGAMTEEARGVVLLATGDPAAAATALRRAFDAWQRIEAPYESARVRMHMGLACRALADEEGAAWALEAARRAFATLGARPDLARVEALMRAADRGGAAAHGLTSRELQVLCLVATGRSNKAIAAELSLSVKTIERHLSNIFRKLNVASRSAATAHALKHHLV